VNVVLGVPKHDRPGRLLIAALTALGVHGSLWCWAARSPRLAAIAPTRAAAAAPTDLDLDLEPLPPPPSRADKPEPDPLVKPPPPAAPAPVAPLPPAVASDVPPPAQAAAIVAAEPDPAASPADLTDTPFVTGTASAYAGGVTAARGTNPTAPHDQDVRPGGALAVHDPTPDLSRPVALAEESWSCGWPREADTAQIDEQTVIIRVVVDTGGAVVSVEVVSDPGHGFGAAAADCALQTRFTPARDRAGDLVRAKSPPIRVRFTR
jgi:protein TonB